MTATRRAGWAFVACVWAVGFQHFSTPDLPLWRQVAAGLALVGLTFTVVLLVRNWRDR